MIPLGNLKSAVVTILVVGPAGVVGTGEGMGGPGDTATLLAVVMGTELVCPSPWKVHRLEMFDGLCCSIPLLSLKRYEPLIDGFLSKEVVSKAILGVSESFWRTPLQQQ